VQTEINDWSLPKAYPDCITPACNIVRVNWESGGDDAHAPGRGRAEESRVAVRGLLAAALRGAAGRHRELQDARFREAFGELAGAGSGPILL
jgi:hypothetical protein